jgi:Mg2+/citrate symporter
MRYQGVIKKSRTLDAAAALAFVNAVFPVLQTNLPAFGLTTQEMAAVNIIGAAVIAFLRFRTTGPVGEK